MTALATSRPVRLARTLLRIALTLGTVAVVLFGAGIVVPKLLGYQSYVITTGSMTGTADRGSLLLAEVVPTDSLAVGDVITYQPPPNTGIRHPVTHRIVDITHAEDGTRQFQTKGDANPTPDSWVFRLNSSVQPRMALAVPAAGWPVLLLMTPGVRILAIGGPALIIGLLALVDIVRELRRPVPRPAPAV